MDLRALRGVVATVVISGAVDPDFANARELMHSWNDRNGYFNVEYRNFHAVLVEAGRDSVCAHALSEKYDWLLMVDADAAPIPVNALEAILHTAYHVVPDSDAVGGYAQLKGSAAPTIDTGSGMWEEHYPGEGILPVIRTGAHFLLVKTSALRKFGPPWFRTRQTKRPIEALAEVDNMARCAFSGANPFEGEKWTTLLDKAKQASATPASSVGEDSGFCDALLAAGGHIYVDTNIVVGHIERRSILPPQFVEAVRNQRARIRLSVGVLE